jgi:hypothetical protein
MCPNPNMIVGLPLSLLTSDLCFDESTLPATAALENAKRRMLRSKGKQLSSFESKTAQLACEFNDMTFDDDSVESFPSIEWNLDDNFSDSEKSLGDWNSILSDCDSGSLGKRGRSQARRLVRSKKIKSDLSSLASIVSCRAA